MIVISIYVMSLKENSYHQLSSHQQSNTTFSQLLRYMPFLHISILKDLNISLITNRCLLNSYLLTIGPT